MQEVILGVLTTLVPRLTFNTALVALADWSLLNEAWKAVYWSAWNGQRGEGKHTGNSRLMTLRLSRHALICVTVLL